MATNPLEEVQKSVEQLDKNIAEFSKRTDSPKDQATINKMKMEIKEAMDPSKTSTEMLAALSDLAGDPKKDPERFLNHQIAFAQHILERTNVHNVNKQSVDQDLAIPRPSVG